MGTGAWPGFEVGGEVSGISLWEGVVGERIQLVIGNSLISL